MIGYYVHHVGQGHVQRAAAIAAHLPAVTALSSLARPSDWRGDWIQLPRDDDGDPGGDVTAAGRLHWAPVGHRGLRERMATLAGWLAAAAPDVLIVDVSVEVVSLARLLGVAVVTIALPGRRDDAAHQLGFELATSVIAPWPDLAPGMAVGLDRHAAKVRHVGGLSRFDGRPVVRSDESGAPTVLRLGGAGGGSARTEAPQPLTPGWHCVDLTGDNWVDDPWPALCAADVVVTHCGLGALSDVAAARRPAVMIPQDRPHDEQYATARALADCGVGIVLERAPVEWTPVLAAARERGGACWSAWSTGDAARRAADVVLETAAGSSC